MSLPDSVRHAHIRALRVSLAHDLHPDFVRLVIELLPGAAAGMLELVRPGPYWREEQRVEILTRNLKQFWAAAPDETLAAVQAIISPGERAEALVKLLHLPGIDHGRVVALAKAALAGNEGNLYLRVRGMLALAQALGDADREAAALALLPDVVQVAQIIRDFGQSWDARQRRIVRKFAGTTELIELARLGGPDEAFQDTMRAIESMLDRDVMGFPYLLARVADVVPFEQLRDWVDPHLLAVGRMWDVSTTVRSWTPFAAPDQLDALVRLVDKRDPWDRAELFARIAHRYPARGAELLSRARKSLEQEDDPYTLVLGLMAVADVTEGAERLRLQSKAVDHLAQEAQGYDELEGMERYNWTWLGKSLEPALRERMVDVLLTFDRYSCWAAIGGVVSTYPPAARTPALRALDRIPESCPLEADQIRAQIDTVVPAQPHDPKLAGEVEDLAVELAAGGYLSYRVDLRERLIGVLDDPEWSDRLELLLDAHQGNEETFWRLLSELIPALMRLGGPAMGETLLALPETTLPSFAQS